MMRSLPLLSVLAAASFLLAGCSDRVVMYQPTVTTEVEPLLEAGHTVGQTFVARQTGLDGLEVWLEPVQDGSGEIYLHLRDDPQTETDLTTAALPLSQVTIPGYYHFSFTSQRASNNRYYYIFLEITGDSTVKVGAGPGAAYLDGALYRDHQPLDSQMAFQLAYNPWWRLVDLAGSAAHGLGLLAVTGLVYVVPGLALLAWLWPGGGLSWAERLGVGVGLSMALYPLILLWTDVARLHLGPLDVWLPVAVGLAVLLWRYRPWQWQLKQSQIALEHWRRSETFWPDVALLITLTLVGLARFHMVRGLDLPLWYDSVQHAAIIQKILESEGLFRSWAPYAPYNTLSTQFGFHADVAAWAWLTRMDALQALLWAGQALNLMAVLTLYPLAYRIKGPWAGVVAVLVAGMFSQFPGYYTNWGRYPQMGGQVVLPIAAWWLWVTLRKEKVNSLGCILGGGGLVAGMALTYYRMAFHYLAFVVAAFLILLPAADRVLLNRRNWLILGATALLAAGLVLPWLQNIYARPQEPTDVPALQTAAPRFWEQVKTLSIGWSAPMAALVLLGTVVGLWGGREAALPVVWLWCLAGLPVLRLTSLPGVAIIQDFTTATSLYMPQALIWGGFAGYVMDKAPFRSQWRSALVSVIIIGVGLEKLPGLLTIIDREYDLSTRADIRAAQWIKESLPDDAVFLINGLVNTDKFSALAADAGAWLPLLTGRGVTIPPQYALLAERPDKPGYSHTVNQLVQSLFEVSPATPEGRTAICSFPYPITHVYLGQRRGMVVKALPSPPSHPMLSVEQLLQDPAFHLIYHRDRVMIFEFNRGVCP